MNAAVVYYTRFGHSRVIAEAVARELGAKLRRVETPKEHGFPYMGFCSLFNIYMRIGPTEIDFSGYDLVVLCAPIWAWRLASPARTLLRDARLPAKLAVCFSTGGGGTKGAQERLKRELAGRDTQIVAFGEINTDKTDDEYLRREARAFAGRLRAGRPDAGSR